MAFYSGLAGKSHARVEGTLTQFLALVPSPLWPKCQGRRPTGARLFSLRRAPSLLTRRPARAREGGLSLNPVPSEVGIPMFAVLQAGGRQVKVAPSDVLRIDRIEAQAGSEIPLRKVLLLRTPDQTHTGTPRVA